ncbi:MAG: hypothetical protein GX589_00785 [Deltaproteobacteria bacterium]|nr:hypothetical protein [Deltaproteobacteria bacterium]
MNRVLRWGLALLLIFTLSACESPIKHLGPAEYGVVFRTLPRFLGGGLANKVRRPGETFILWPWDTVYVFDTKIQTLEWGQAGRGSNSTRDDYVQTRAVDGNEVSLAVRVQFAITTDEKDLLYLVQNVGTSNAAVEQVVIAAARADLRTAMNRLKTGEFLINVAKYRGESDAKKALQDRLGPYGINIVSVNLSEHRFERVLADGSIDRSYQERINRIQALEQETAREVLNIEAVKADKEREYNNIQAVVNAQVAEAEGYKNQARLRGDGYSEAKQNEAKGVLASGQAQASGLAAQVAALSGPGGRAILKLDLSRNLQKAEPKFVLMGKTAPGEEGIEVKRIDTNELLKQIGVFEGLSK